MTDVAPQIAIHMVKKEPAVQTNNVDMQSESGCLATLPRILLQLYVGPDNVEQTRNSSHFVGGGKDDQIK